jgi:hypothetical protein
MRFYPNKLSPRKWVVHNFNNLGIAIDIKPQNFCQISVKLAKSITYVFFYGKLAS